MIVVSNTSPLNYLILLEKDHVLPVLFKSVAAPPAVVAELSRQGAPEPVRAWIQTPPPWFRVESPLAVEASLDLDAGECEAIALAEQLRADRILLDEAKARQIASARGLRVVGTLAVLFEAGQLGLLDFGEALHELRKTTFHLDERIVQALLERSGGRGS